jgi:hypothetical protein
MPSDLLAQPKSRMLVEASHSKLFPQMLPAQLLMAHSSGFKFHKPEAWPQLNVMFTCTSPVDKYGNMWLSHLASCS